MADKKISQLTGATTPLAGTEVLPIVQSSTTKKVSVADLTAGRVTALGNKSTVGGSSGFPFLPFDGMLVGADVNAGVKIGIVNQDTGSSASAGLGFYAAGGSWTFEMPRDVTTFQNPLIAKFGTNEVFRFTYDGNFKPVAGKGIDFSANTHAAGMTSELLNWYEVGTWTPTGFGITFASATGKYTRIGNIVVCTFAVTFPTTADANVAYITGLPFAASADCGVAMGAYATDLTYATAVGNTYLVPKNTAGNAFKTNADLSTQSILGSVSYPV
jgi:hypothetical protein